MKFSFIFLFLSGYRFSRSKSFNDLSYKDLQDSVNKFKSPFATIHTAHDLFGLPIVEVSID